MKSTFTYTDPDTKQKVTLNCPEWFVYSWIAYVGCNMVSRAVFFFGVAYIWWHS